MKLTTFFLFIMSNYFPLHPKELRLEETNSHMEAPCHLSDPEPWGRSREGAFIAKSQTCSALKWNFTVRAHESSLLNPSRVCARNHGLVQQNINKQVKVCNLALKQGLGWVVWALRARHHEVAQSL